MDGVPAVLEELRRRLVPTCDPGTVRRVFAAATSGHGTSVRLRDGRRASALTRAGVPCEVSVTGGRTAPSAADGATGGRSAAALRYATEPGAGLPFFASRLAVQRRALDEMVRRLPAAAHPVADELRALPEVLFPDPGAVRARTRFATFLGIVHRPEHPRHLAGLKVYANVRTGGAGDALERLGARWSAFDALAGPLRSVPGTAPQFAAVEVDAAGHLTHKLYARTGTGGGDPAVPALAGALGIDVGPLAEALRGAGASPGVSGVGGEVWQRSFLVGCARREGDAGLAPRIELTVHLSPRALGCDARRLPAIVGRLVDALGDPCGFDALRATTGAGTEDPDAAWSLTIAGVGFAPGAGVTKVNVYAAPVPAELRPRR